MILNQTLKDNDIGVYYIHCIPTDKYYVGYSTNLKKRYKDHRNGLRGNYHINQYLQNAFNKYGEDAFLFSIISYCDSKETATFWEEGIIREWDLVNRDKGFNLQYGGDSNELADEIKKRIGDKGRGRKHTEEARLKMSKSRKGKTSWKKGKTYNEIYGKEKANDLKNTLSQKFTGTNNHFYGRTHSKESITKQRESKLSQSLKCEFIDPKRNKYYPETFSSFCKENDLDKAAMYRVRKGKQAHHHGWTCRELKTEKER